MRTRLSFFCALVVSAVMLASCTKEDKTYHPGNISGSWSYLDITTSSVFSLVISAEILPNNAYYCSFRTRQLGQKDTTIMDGFVTYDSGKGNGAISTSSRGLFAGSISNVTDFSMRLYLVRTVAGTEVVIFNGVLQRD